MKIVILDGYTLNPGDLTWNELKQYGEVINYDRTGDDTNLIIERINDAEIVLTNKTPINEEVINSCPNLKYIGVLATGYNVIDVKKADEKGIIVSNIPNYGSRAVSQFAISLLLEICNRVGHHSEVVKQGKWSTNPDWCFWDYPLVELEHKTIGIIGFGKIGRCTGQIAVSLGMKALAYDSFQDDEGKSIATYVSLEELFKESDVIALHCPLLSSTEGIINKNNIDKMKDGVIIINNSRGPLIVEADLVEALNSGKILAAGIDVVSVEPIANNSPLLSAKNCFITPHISWAAKETRERLLNLAVQNLKSFVEGKPINIIK